MLLLGAPLYSAILKPNKPDDGKVENSESNETQ
jgi:hypothetical protein